MVKVGVYTGVTTDVEFCCLCRQLCNVNVCITRDIHVHLADFHFVEFDARVTSNVKCQFVYLKRVLESEGSVTSLIHSNELWACYIYLYYISSVVRTIKEDDSFL